MSDTLTDLKSRIPPLDQENITNWLVEIRAVLMGKKRSHLVLLHPRPSRDDFHAAQLAPAALRRYEEKLQDDQDEWDERNDIVICALMESANGPASVEGKQIIKDMSLQNRTAHEITSALVDRFDTHDPRVVNAMMKHFSEIKLIRPENATSVINRLNEAKSELAKKGKVFTNGELVGRLLDALTGDDRYTANVAAMNTMPNITYGEAVTQLRAKDLIDSISHKKPKETTVALTSVHKYRLPNLRQERTLCPKVPLEEQQCGDSKRKRISEQIWYERQISHQMP